MALPLLVLYLPATQDVQVPPSGPVLPAAHAGTTHAFTDDVPLTEVVPAGQAMHVVELVLANNAEYVPDGQFVQASFAIIVSLYLPAVHAEQVALFPSGPVNPLAQTH